MFVSWLRFFIFFKPFYICCITFLPVQMCFCFTRFKIICATNYVLFHLVCVCVCVCALCFVLAVMRKCPNTLKEMSRLDLTLLFCVVLSLSRILTRA